MTAESTLAGLAGRGAHGRDTGEAGCAIYGTAAIGIGSGAVNDLAPRIGRAVGAPIDIVPIERRDIDNIRRSVVNMEKARRMLRWSPQVTLTGLDRMSDNQAASAERSGTVRWSGRDVSLIDKPQELEGPMIQTPMISSSVSAITVGTRLARPFETNVTPIALP